MIIGTIVNASGLPQARLMAASVKRIMPETTIVVCLVEHFYGQPNGLYIDQPYLNFVPTIYHTGVLRHPGYNLAFWNLHERCRELYWVEDQYYLTDWTLLHCVNFNNTAGLLDSCMNAFIPDNWVYAQMWKNYKQELESLLPWQASSSWSYDFFYSGEKISDETRLRYREAKIYHPIEVNPFTLSNETQF